MTDTRTTEERRIEKIALLLKKAESTTPEEAEALTAMAEKLMIQHGINEAMLAATRLGKERTREEIVTKRVNFSGIYARAYVMMANEIVHSLGEMRTYLVRGQGEESLVIVGFEGDVAQAVTLVTSLQLQAVVALGQHIKDDWEWKYYSASQKYNERRTFILGFGRGAGIRIADSKLKVISEVNAAQPSGAGTELVLAARKDQVDKYMDNQVGPLKKGRGMRVSGSSYGEGVRAGKNANTGGTQVGGSRTELRG